MKYLPDKKGKIFSEYAYGNKKEFINDEKYSLLSFLMSFFFKYKSKVFLTATKIILFGIKYYTMK
jgi:hypothetical protein